MSSSSLHEEEEKEEWEGELEVKRNEKGQTKWDKRSRIRSFFFCRFLQIFADSAFLCELQHFRRRRFFAENRRKPQIFAETGLSH